MKQRSKDIRTGIKNIGELLHCANNNELRDVFYSYSTDITFDILDYNPSHRSLYPVPEQTGYPVNMAWYKEVDTISYIRREIYYIN